MIKNLIIGLFLVSMFASCSEEEFPIDPVLPEADLGAVVVNQGTFGTGTGTLTI